MIIKYEKCQGLFCFLKIILRNLIEIQIMKNRKIIIDISEPFYPYKNDMNDLNNNLFEIKSISENEQIKELLKDFQLKNNKYNQYWSNHLNNEIKHKIFLKYFKLNDKIHDKVNNICSKFNDKFVIGIHYRSHVAKISENRNQKPGYKIKNIKDYVNTIKKYVLDNNIKKFKLYLVTDILSNIETFKKEFNDLIIVNDNNIWLSKDNNDIEPHFGFSLCNKNLNDINFIKYFNKKKPGLNGAIELFTDVMVLSKCNVFLNSISNLSYFVKILNPNIKTINIQDY